MDETKCDPVHCPYARGHFDRVNDAVYELWTTKSRYDRETIREQAEKWQVCPFEMCLDLSLWVDAVICDYNYVFDPTVHLKRFFGDGAGGDYIFLIDEAHNLAERGREMYSASICREDAVRVRKVMKERAPRLYRSLGKLDKQLKELQEECGNYLVLPGTGSITMTILKVQGEFDAFLPMSYYRKLLSCRQDDYGIYVESPFSQKNRCILNAGDVSSLYSRRGYEEYHKIAEYIARTVWQRQGNYMVFFPSYKMLEEVYAVYEEEFSVNWVKCICQNSSMKEQEREEFLREFEQDQESLVAFCIMGGIFSEGIDLLGEKLIGAILVGTGLPQLGNEREILRSFYTENGENGFDYAYRYPGMNKVLQAAGRVIRTKEDHGVILLLDERFRQREYSNLFPVEWNDRKTCTLSNVEAQLQKFWESIPDKISRKL